MKRILGKTKGWKLGRFMMSPWVILASATLGGVFGSYYPQMSHSLAPAGELYLRLLEMCILPILITAITLNVGKMIIAGDQLGQAKKLLIIAFLLLFGSSVVGIIGGLIGQPGSLDNASREALGAIVLESGQAPDLEINIDSPYVEPNTESITVGFLKRMVPQNVFESLSSGNSLKILVFSIMFGLALGVTYTKTSATVFEMLDASYLAFSTLVQWVMYVLPFGIFAMIASQTANSGFDALFVMTKFVVVTIAAFLAIMVICCILLWRRSNKPLMDIVNGLKEPVFLSMGTGNSLACIPSSVTSMESLGFSKRDINLTVPLGIIICRYGNIVYFAVATLFVAQIYNVSMGPANLGFLLIGAVLAGTATVGASGALTLVMLDIILAPLGLPLTAVLALFIVVEPIMTPLRTAVNVFVNCVMAGLWAKNEDDEVQDHVELPVAETEHPA